MSQYTMTKYCFKFDIFTRQADTLNISSAVVLGLRYYFNLLRDPTLTTSRIFVHGFWSLFVCPYIRLGRRNQLKDQRQELKSEKKTLFQHYNSYGTVITLFIYFFYLGIDQRRKRPVACVLEQLKLIFNFMKQLKLIINISVNRTERN